MDKKRKPVVPFKDKAGQLIVVRTEGVGACPSRAWPLVRVTASQIVIAYNDIATGRFHRIGKWSKGMPIPKRHGYSYSRLTHAEIDRVVAPWEQAHAKPEGRG